MATVSYVGFFAPKSAVVKSLISKSNLGACFTVNRLICSCEKIQAIRTANVFWGVVYSMMGPLCLGAVCAIAWVNRLTPTVKSQPCAATVESCTVEVTRRSRKKIGSTMHRKQDKPDARPGRIPYPIEGPIFRLHCCHQVFCQFVCFRECRCGKFEPQARC